MSIERLMNGGLRLAPGCALALWLLMSSTAAIAGPFTEPGHAPGAMVDWATAVDEVVRGPEDINALSSPLASFGVEANVLGPATGASTDTLSLGDGGSITVYLESGISNGPADDFAIFENAFFEVFDLFAELAFVEVASNGIDYARFEVETLAELPVASYGTLDPSDYYGLAGRHAAPLGTGFDLADLAFDPLVQSGDVDLMDIRYVRLIDVIGDGSTVDALGRAIFDPYPTAFAAGGFDLEAVGVIHVPEPRFMLGLLLGLLGLLGLGLRQRSRDRALGSRRAMSATRGRTFAIALLSTWSFVSAAHALTATFDDLGLGVDAVENGAGLAGGYDSGGIFFENTYFASFDGFAGFAASTRTDTTTPGFGNQFSNITGSGAGGSAGYGIFYPGGRVVLPTVQTVLSADFTNTTYAALSMAHGDAFAKQFGGEFGDDEDYLRLLVEGFDEVGDSTGVVELMLADYRFSNNLLDYILDEWTTLDLTGLGQVKELGFGFESSDVGSFGINTPTYFAIDNLVTIPEPGTAILLGLGLLGLARRPRLAR